MNCPHCKTASFFTKEYETVEIDQCKECQGIWLDHNEITQIVTNLATDFSEIETKKTVSSAFSGIPKGEFKKERLCPKCSSAMCPINYTVDSGVIIDRCPNDHGVWLDFFELEQVQQYREYWQENAKKSIGHFTQLAQSIEKDSDDKDSSISLIYDLSIKVGSKIFGK
jgi:Zn-finger nucleic acid-binding protein